MGTLAGRAELASLRDTAPSLGCSSTSNTRRASGRGARDQPFRSIAGQYPKRYRKDGPVAVAQFELGIDDALREERLLRQRNVTDLVTRFLKTIEPAM